MRRGTERVVGGDQLTRMRTFDDCRRVDDVTEAESTDEVLIQL